MNTGLTGFDVAERGATSEQAGVTYGLKQRVTITTANDYAGKPIGFGNVFFGSSAKEATSVVPFPMFVEPWSQPEALSA